MINAKIRVEEGVLEKGAAWGMNGARSEDVETGLEDWGPRKEEQGHQGKHLEYAYVGSTPRYSHDPCKSG